jgi:hypothetical protein
VIPIGTTANTADPFITPPSTTIGKHAIPERPIALTSLSRYDTSENWPQTTHAVDNAWRWNTSKAKGTTIKRMCNDIIGIPRTTATVTSKSTAFWIIKFNPIGIDSIVCTSTIFLAQPTTGLIANTYSEKIRESTLKS